MADTPGDSQTWSDIARWMRASAPVNKGAGKQIGRRIPQIASPVVIGALGVGALGVGLAMRAMRPARRQGRSSRFRTLILASIDEAIRTKIDDLDPAVPIDVSAEVGEAFGKPALASFDIIVPEGLGLDPATIAKLLDVAARAVWDNAELAPLTIRGRVLESPGAAASTDSPTETEAAPTSQNGKTNKAPEAATALADMTDIGFESATALPADLYDRYGSPASDRTWRP